MNITKLALAGTLALSLAACHQPGHRLCDNPDKGKRTACIILVVGAIKAVKLIALHSSAAALPE